MIRTLTTLLVALCLLAGCNNGGGGSASEGGIGGTGITRGVITATGSATVAGTRYDTSSATLVFDGDSMSGRMLELGMKVRVTGTRTGDTGVASEVDFDDDLEGPVDSITPRPTNPDKADVVILDQTVVIERDVTVFAPGIDFDTLAAGDVVEVSGLRAGDGTLTATWLRFVSTDPTPQVELKGVAANRDISNPSLASFEIGAITVRFAIGTTQLPDGTPRNGDFVEVKGMFDGVDTVDADTTVDRIEILEPDMGNVADFELEGIVSGFASLSSFEVDGQPVSAGGFGVVFEPANSSFVKNGARVEVEGSLQNGVLVAREVTQRGGEVRIRAEVGEAPVSGVLTLLGSIEVQADSATRFDDECTGITFDAIDDLGVGDFVEVRGVRLGPALVLASEMKCLDAGSEVELQGRVQGFDATFQNVTILGVQIPVDPMAGGTQFEDFPAPGVSSAAQFFSFLASNPNALLSVKDEDDGDATTLDVADEIEYEEDD